ncbi:MAG: DUF3267 domain-containing protein [Bacteroidales bacterium]|nr:DUF3267 domain-containing protein [Bacteroidales bacterium]
MKTKNELLKKEYTMGFGKVNLYAILLIFPISIVYLSFFFLIWGDERIQLGIESIMDYFFYILISGIIFHELLHGITWGSFASKGIKSIKFGFKWKYLTPYCHCKEALKVKHYKLGAAMPLIVLGIIPSVYGIISGNGTIFLYGLLFTYAAAGDIIGLFMLRKLDNNICVFDHPEKMGFFTEDSQACSEHS